VYLPVALKRSILIATGVLATLVVALLLVRSLRSPPSALVEGWRVVSGGLDRIPEGEEEIFTASAGTRIESDGVVVEVEDGARLVFSAAGAAPGIPIPEIVAGSMRVTIPATGSRAIHLAGRQLKPEGAAGSAAEFATEFTVTSDSIEVIAGFLRIEDALLSPGGVFQRVSVHGLAREGAERDGDSAPASSAGGPGSSVGDSEAPDGRVIDARSGAPIAGVEIRAVFSHSDDGYPPHPEAGSRQSAATDREGNFRLAPFRPDDPRLFLHIEADHADYLPLVRVFEASPDLDGRRPFVTLSLRGESTTRLSFYDPENRPLGGEAMEVSQNRGDRFIGEDSWDEGRSVRPDRPLIRYTEDDGTLRVGLSAVAFTLRHPRYHFFYDAYRTPLATISADLRESLKAGADGRKWQSEWAKYSVRSGDPAAYRLLDQWGTSVAGALIEILLEEMPPVRLYTGPEGEFEFAPRPFDPRLPPLSPDNPRRGTITVLSPELWKRGVPVDLPSRATLFTVEGRIAGELSLRAVVRVDDESVAPIPPNEIHLEGELTLVHRTRSGEASWVGSLPLGATEVAVSLRGYLPRQVIVPPHLPGEMRLDLGEVEFERGGQLAVQLAGGGEVAASQARLQLAAEHWPRPSQEYRFDASGRAIIGGIEEGRVYRYALAGSRIEPQEGEFLATKKIFETGLMVAIEPSREVEVLLRGDTAGIPPDDRPFYRVIERYFIEGEAEPVSCSSYLLPPDGRVGSRRFLRRPARAEVFVVGPAFQVGYSWKDRRPDAWEFDLGIIAIAPGPRAELSFVVPGLGPVGAPGGLSFFAEENLYHEVARLHGGRPVVIENLRPGGYVLRWNENEAESIFPFVVREGDLVIRAAIPRRPLDVETVETQLADSGGKPIDGATVTGNAVATPGLTAGSYLLEIKPKEETRVVFKADRFLPVALVRPPESEFPAKVVLHRPAAARATLRDTDRLPLYGTIRVDWESEPPAAEGEVALRHGEPVAVEVRHGRFAAASLAPGPHRLRFRLEHSEAAAEVSADLPEEKESDLGIVQLEETRSLRGIVYLPTGEPAPKARVALVEPGSVHRFPGREKDLGALKFSVEANGVGRFEISGLPVDLNADLALVARLTGFTDGIEHPINLSLDDHFLSLDLGADVILNLGYGSGSSPEGFEFRLAHAAAPGESFSDLGPYPPYDPGGRRFAEVTPGVYRATWGPVEPHPGIPPASAEALVRPGTLSRLNLRIPDRFLPGEAYFNGALLERGWLVLTDDPGDPARLRSTRVGGGSFLAPISPQADRLFTLLIPERDPLPSPDFSAEAPRGVAIFHEVAGFRAALRSGRLRIEYQAWKLTVRLPDGLLGRHPDTQIEFPHSVWDGSRFRRENRSQPVTTQSIQLDLVPPGPFPFRIFSRSGPRFFQTIDLHEDTRISLGN